MDADDKMPREDWKWQVLDRFDTFVEERFGETNELLDFLTEPEWRTQATYKSITAMMPSTPLRQGVSITPEYLGGVVGHQHSLWHSIVIDGRLDSDFQALREMAAKIVAKGNELREKQGTLTEQVEEFFKAAAGLEEFCRCDPLADMREAFPDFEKLVMWARSFAHEQSIEEADAFMDGYQKARKKGSINNSGRPIAETLATPIYHLLSFFGPALTDNFKTAKEFDTFLRTVLGAGFGGDPERTRKLAHRLGLSFGKPGRPKGGARP